MVVIGGLVGRADAIPEPESEKDKSDISGGNRSVLRKSWVDRFRENGHLLEGIGPLALLVRCVPQTERGCLFVSPRSIRTLRELWLPGLRTCTRKSDGR